MAHKATAGTGRAVVSLLGVTFLVVAGLLVQSGLSLRSHRAMIGATLGDFSGFAADRVANELDQTFTGLFLDQISLARAAHYLWSSDRMATIDRPEGDRALPRGAILFFFSVDDRAASDPMATDLATSGLIATDVAATGARLVRHGRGSDPELERMALEEVLGHRTIYPRPAPYAVLRDDRSTAVVYRKEPRYEGEGIYGFVVDFAAFDSWYDRIIEETSLLPRSLGDDAAREGLIEIGLHLTPQTEPLFSRGTEVDGPIAWAFAAKAGRLAVGARIDEARAGVLIVGGGPGAGIPVLSGLALLTLALLAIAVWLFRRTTRLAGLRERFVANVSHDLRTPITQIQMFSESLLLERIPDAAEQTRSLGIIHRQAEILGDLVDNILQASSNRPELRPVPTALRPLVRDVADSFTHARRDAPPRIRWSLSGTEDAVIDPIATTRILTNLMDNAIRHAGDSQVRVHLDAGPEGLRLSVEDDGPGIAPADRERVFERFERLSPGADITGAGIGLAVVRDLARRHGGEAFVEESELGGVRIEVTLKAVS